MENTDKKLLYEKDYNGKNKSVFDSDTLDSLEY